MSQYYNVPRTRNLYVPGEKQPFKLSRSKIDLYIGCPKCFYLDRRLGVGRPPGFPFTLNNAVDALLKKEFDILRQEGSSHPLIKKYGVDALPVKDTNLDAWRNNFKGVQYHHKPTNFIVTGAIDDLWINSKNEYIVVDYKATSKNEEITALNKQWQDSYKRQMEIYQWLLRKNNYLVSETGYFVYCNGKTNVDKFDGKLEFDITLISYKGNSDWVEGLIQEIYHCLSGDQIPSSGKDCDFCRYRNAAEKLSH